MICDLVHDIVDSIAHVLTFNYTLTIYRLIFDFCTENFNVLCTYIMMQTFAILLKIQICVLINHVWYQIVRNEKQIPKWSFLF